MVSQAEAERPMPRVIREHKRHYNKPDQVFECEALYHDGRTLVLRYVTDREYQVAGQTIHPGSVTLGLYRAEETFVFWKMLSPEGETQGYLAHLCEPIQLRKDEVEYRDLMLDIWEQPGSPAVLLDEEDLEAALERGQIDRASAEAVLEEARRLLSRFPDVVTDAEKILGV